MTNNKSEVTMLGYFNGIQKDYSITAESTAISLLIMYPFFKPVSDTANTLLVIAYKKEDDFEHLTLKVNALIKQGVDVFSTDDSELIDLIINLVKKNYYSDIVRARPSADDPIDITTSETAVTLHNNTTYSYAGGIYRNNQNIKSFLLAGSTLAGSRFYQFRPGYELPKEDMQSERSLDLKTLGNLPGSYEIKLRNGLAIDGTIEDDFAFNENIYELLISIIDNLIPSKLIKLNNDCLNEILNHLIKAAKIQFKNDPKSDFIKDIAIPFFSDYTTIVKECSGQKVDDYLNLVFKYIKDFKKATGPLATLYFNAEWILRSKAIDACKVMDDEGKVVNCFLLQKAENIKARNYICDTIDLKIKAVEDEKYYPYEGNPIPNLDFAWLSTKGNGGFLPLGAINAPAKTDDQGEASIKWLLTDNPVQNSAQATKYVGNTQVSKVDFNTTSYKPSPSIKILESSNNQTGPPGMALAQPLQISVIDLTDNLPMPINRFLIDWKVEKGTGTIIAVPSSTPYDSSFNWTLGPVKGEQSVTFTLFSKTCDGFIKENPIMFKATANSLPVLSTSNISSITQTTAIGGGNISSTGGSSVIVSGICWSTSQNPTIANSKTSDGTGTGTFTSNITGLTANTKYYVRAYATNSAGTAYGNEISFRTLSSLEGTTRWRGYYTSSSYPDGTKFYGELQIRTSNSLQASGVWYPSYNNVPDNISNIVGMTFRGILNSDASAFNWESGKNGTLDLLFPEPWNISGNTLSGKLNITQIGNPDFNTGTYTFSSLVKQ